MEKVGFEKVSIKKLGGYSKFEDGLIELAEATIGVRYYDYQKELIKIVLDDLLHKKGNEIVVCFPRQSGKTEAVSGLLYIILVLLPGIVEKIEELQIYSKGVLVGLFAPVYEQGDTTWDRLMLKLEAKGVQEVLVDNEIGGEYEASGRKVRFKNGSQLRLQSLAKTSKIESKSYNIVFIEEAQYADRDKVRRSVHPMVSAFNGSIVKIGTPVPENCEFKEAFKRAKKKGKTITFGYKRVIKDKKKIYKETKDKFHLLYTKAIKKEKERLGEDSDDFRTSYNAEWVGVVEEIMSEEKWNVLVDKNLEFWSIRRDAPLFAGVDIGKTTAKSVLMLGTPIDVGAFERGDYPPLQIVKVIEYPSERLSLQYDKIKSDLEIWSPDSVVVDATGLGAGLASFLADELWDMDVIEFTENNWTKDRASRMLVRVIDKGGMIIPGGRSSRKMRGWKKMKEEFLDVRKAFRSRFMYIYSESGGLLDYVSAAMFMLRAYYGDYGMDEGGVEIMHYERSKGGIRIIEGGDEE